MKILAEFYNDDVLKSYIVERNDGKVIEIRVNYRNNYKNRFKFKYGVDKNYDGKM
ncbi:MAG: hypothetical protein RR359_02830 [Bacilli bacterium]